MNIFEQIGVTVRNRAPEILLGLGLGGMVGGTIYACKGTLKATEVIMEANSKFEEIEIAKECAVNTTQTYDEDDIRRDKVQVTKEMWKGLIKCYAPAVGLTVGGAALILGSHSILRKRNVALAGTVVALGEAYDKLTDRVEKEFGAEKAKELRAGVEKQEIEVETTDKKGNTTQKKKSIKAMNGEGISPYARFFDSGCGSWENDNNYNLTFLTGLERQFTDELDSKGFVFLNDVYDALGIPRTTIGQDVGWLSKKYNPKGDGYVSFNIFQTESVANREFVNGYEDVILLDFNVDGYITDKIDLINGMLVKKEK